MREGCLRLGGKKITRKTRVVWTQQKGGPRTSSSDAGKLGKGLPQRLARGTENSEEKGCKKKKRVDVNFARTREMVGTFWEKDVNGVKGRP